MLSILVAALTGLWLHVANGDDLTFQEAMKATKPIADLRMRYEGVDEDGFAEDAAAGTIRGRFGFQTGSVWGITHFLRVATAAHARNLPVSPVGYNANPVAHAAAAMPNMIGIEVQDWNTPAGLTVDQTIADGGVRLGDAPGLGIEIDEAALANGAAPGWNSAGGPHRRARQAGLRLVPDGPQAAE